MTEPKVFRFPCPKVPLGEQGAQLVRRLREFLEQSGYEEKEICRRMGIEDELLDFDSIIKDPDRFKDEDLVGVLMRLFLRGESFPVNELPPCLPASAVETMRALGVLIQPEDVPGRCCASCALYPTRGIFLASDRWYTPDDSVYLAPFDIVFPGISGLTHSYMNALPQHPRGTFLELCGGTGVAAVFAAKNYAQQAWATDIAERSTEYAEFNFRLNELPNGVALTGDLYEPVRGLRFDVITAHPPYVPSLRKDALYADGGPDGERITRGVIQSLPEFLNPGGVCYCMTLGTNRKDASFEHRVHSWLGESGPEFDVGFFVRRDITNLEFASQSTVQFQGGNALLREWKQFFEKQSIEKLVQGLIVVQRHAAPRPAFTTRRYIGEQTTRFEVEWHMHLEEAAIEPQFLARLRESHVRPTEHVKLFMRHRIANKRLEPENLRLDTDFPFGVECTLEPWAGYLLALCDGTLTTAELLEASKKEGIIHPDAPEHDFLVFMKSLVMGGFVESDACPMPTAQERKPIVSVEAVKRELET